jgi:hypothetical protein
MKTYALITDQTNGEEAISKALARSGARASACSGF